MRNKGQQAEVRVGALGDKLFTGAVSEKGIANPLHTYEVKIVKQYQHELMPGMVQKGVHSRETEAGIVLPTHTVQVTTRWKEVCG